MPRIIRGPRLLAVARLVRAAPRCAVPLMIAGACASTTTVPASPIALLGGMLAHLRPASRRRATEPSSAPSILQPKGSYFAAA